MTNFTARSQIGLHRKFAELHIPMHAGERRTRFRGAPLPTMHGVLCRYSPRHRRSP